MKQMRSQVLLLTDDPVAGQAWAAVLARHGIDPTVGSAERALGEWEQNGFDVTVVDAACCETGIALCKRLRSDSVSPIVLLCPQGDEHCLLEGYRSGADECARRSVSPAVLVAKVEAWLCQRWTVRIEALHALERGGLRLEPETHEAVRADGLRVRLSALEFRLVYLLMSRMGQALSPESAIADVWGRRGSANRQALHRVVHRLRGKIEVDPLRPRYIRTVSGEGYVFGG
jgi:two-component system response regulator MtrA